MSREKINISKLILREVLGGKYSKNPDYELMENKIDSSDEEDGGAWHSVVIKRKSDERYFGFEYCDWDMIYNFDRDFPEELTEVFPKQVTITIYE
jgi:hypothetical protein